MFKTLLVLFAMSLMITACAIAPSPTSTPTIATTQSIDPSPVSPATITTAPPSPTVEQPVHTSVVLPSPTDTPLSGQGNVVYRIVPGESQLTYEVGEVFINENNRFNVAVGVTSQINGEIMLDLDAPQNSRLGVITADISQFKSDSSRRDNAIRNRFLESARYPTVTFVATQIEGLPQAYQPGQEIQLKISGDLTIRQVTKAVTFEVSVKHQGDALIGQASTTILMSDFGFGPISIVGILKTEDQVKVTLKFVARP